MIDKALASAKLAEEVGADTLIIATDVKGAAILYGEPGEKFLGKIGVEEAERYLREGNFAPGSMGLKVEAALQFIKSGGDLLHRRNRKNPRRECGYEIVRC